MVSVRRYPCLFALLAVLALVCLDDASARAAEPAWVQVDSARNPSQRQEAAMTYDAATEQVVLYGGALAAGGYGDDTWT